MEQKVVFAGPAGAGKTTAISAISDIEVVKTEAKSSDGVELGKHHTTVAMDYGALHLDDGSWVNLYGVPGQERFSFMWDVLAVGSIGVVLLIDGSGEAPLADLEFYTDAFKKVIVKSAVAVGVTHMDKSPHPTLSMYNTRLRLLGITAPVFEVDARSRKDIQSLLMGLLTTLEPGARRI